MSKITLFLRTRQLLREIPIIIKLEYFNYYLTRYFPTPKLKLFLAIYLFTMATKIAITIP